MISQNETYDTSKLPVWVQVCPSAFQQDELGLDHMHGYECGQKNVRGSNIK